jgi:hypothetical protein
VCGSENRATKGKKDRLRDRAEKRTSGVQCCRASRGSRLLTCCCSSTRKRSQWNVVRNLLINLHVKIPQLLVFRTLYGDISSPQKASFQILRTQSHAHVHCLPGVRSYFERAGAPLCVWAECLRRETQCKKPSNGAAFSVKGLTMACSPASR